MFPCNHVFQAGKGFQAWTQELMFNVEALVTVSLVKGSYQTKGSGLREEAGSSE